MQLRPSWTNSQLAKFVEKLPNTTSALINSVIDLSRAAIENHWLPFFRSDDVGLKVYPGPYQFHSMIKD